MNHLKFIRFFIFCVVIVLCLTQNVDEEPVVVKREQGSWHQDVKKWNDGWDRGEWNYMAKVPIELSRNAMSTAVYASLLAPKGVILDMGCAEGTSAMYLNRYQRQHFVGVDWSEVAIRRARSRYPNVEFVTDSVQNYEPKKKFDLMIFNDVLMFVEPDSTLRKYIKYLNRGGYMVISMFFQPDRSNNYDTDKYFKEARLLMRFYDSMRVQGHVWHNNRTENKHTSEIQKTSYRMEVYCNDL